MPHGSLTWIYTSVELCKKNFLAYNMWPRETAYKYYTILSHSGHEKKLNLKTVPDNIILVLVTKCGQSFSQNNKFKETYKNENKMKAYLENGQVNKNIYNKTTNPQYENQEIELNRYNKRILLHGVYKLPMNIRPMSNNTYSIIHRQIKLAEEIKKLKINQKTTTSVQTGRKLQVKITDLQKQLNNLYGMTVNNTRKFNNVTRTSLVPLQKPLLSDILGTISRQVGSGYTGVVFGTYCRGVLNNVNNTNTARNVVLNFPKQKKVVVMSKSRFYRFGKNKIHERHKTLRNGPIRKIAHEYKERIKNVPSGQKSILLNQTKRKSLKKVLFSLFRRK